MTPNCKTPGKMQPSHISKKGKVRVRGQPEDSATKAIPFLSHISPSLLPWCLFYFVFKVNFLIHNVPSREPPNLLENLLVLGFSEVLLHGAVIK